MTGIALWRWRTVAIVLSVFGAALVAVTLWRGDPIWTSVTAVGTLLLGWGLAVVRRRPRAAPWLALVGILAALTGVGAGNLWTGGKAVVEMFSNTAQRVSPPTEATPPAPGGETTPPTEPAPLTPPTEPAPITPPAEPAPPDTTSPPPVPDSTPSTPENPALTPPAEPTPPTLPQPDTTQPPQPPTEPASPSENAAATSISSCPCTLDVRANVTGANVTLLRDGQVEATGQVPATFVNLPAGAYTLRVEVAGYKPFEGEIPLSESRNIVVRLEP